MFHSCLKLLFPAILLSLAGCSDISYKCSEPESSDKDTSSVNGVNDTAFVILGNPLPVERFVPESIRQSGNPVLMVDYSVINEPNYVFYSYQNDSGETVSERSDCAVVLVDQEPCEISVSDPLLKVKKGYTINLSEFIQVTNRIYLSDSEYEDYQLDFIHGMVPGFDLTHAKPGYVIYDMSSNSFLDDVIFEGDIPADHPMIIIASDGNGNIALNFELTVRIIS